MTAVAIELPADPGRAVQWQDRARCKGADPELFFPQVGGDNGEEAKRFCRGCDVRYECLSYALAWPGTDGIWGGTSNHQRQQIRAGRA